MKRYNKFTRPKPKVRPPEFGGKPRAEAPPSAPQVSAAEASEKPVKPLPPKLKAAMPPKGPAKFTPKFGPKTGPKFGPKFPPKKQGGGPFEGRERRPPVKASMRATPAADRPRTDWNQIAESYDELVGDKGSEYHQKVVLPGVRRLLEVAGGGEGKRILDVACGQGVVCRALHEKGATVVGVDAARKLLDLAAQRSDPAVTYIAGDVRDLPEIKEIEPESFDAVSLVLAIQDIHPLPPLFQGIAHALKKGGKAVIVMMHPAFRGPKATSWGWDGHDVQYRRVDRYLVPRKEPIVSHPGKKSGEYTWSFHRPIETYVNGLVKAGLLIDRIEEWASHKVSGPGPRAKAENVAREEIPMFMAIRAVKA